ncbi:carbohydrate ABC transporter permease [Marinitoga sp. 1135]|uniref:carbohydrate ABC transporter permease n=1 Tax=Marinitoga sp. 1135 TaxID=1643333 RepID=UPI001C318EFF|nr:sugar ABC transporter permease [Marinitoga sp. 1135]
MPAEILIPVIGVSIAVVLFVIMKVSKYFLSPHAWRRTRESITAYLYLLPSMIVLSIFVFWPIIYSFVLSFFKWDFKNQANPQFIGFDNYIQLFKLKHPVSMTFNVAFLGTFFLIFATIYFLTVLLDLKRISDKKVKNIIILNAVISAITFILWNVISYQLQWIIFLWLAFSYTAIAAMKKIEGTPDKLLLRMIILITVYVAGIKLIHIPEIVTYLSMAKEEADFLKAIWNTSYYVLLSMPITIFLSLVIAMLFYQEVKGKVVFRTIYFIPFVTSVVAVSLVWQWIFNDNGLLNYILSFFGVEKILWLKDEKWTIPTIAIISIWKLVGYYSIIFLAGLQNIDKSYYEAAEVDGANSWQKFVHITWPLLSPTTFFILIVSMIGAFKVFSEIFVLYSGLPGPYNNSGLTVVYYVFEKFYGEQRMGQASAAAYVLFGIILIFTFIQFVAGKKRVHYDS